MQIFQSLGCSESKNLSGFSNSDVSKKIVEIACVLCRVVQIHVR